ncbi:MarC family protein [Elioraea sp. Yellowstone]|jgi:multiple antibiotic resistance protein|uniref:MarC family protein n=1 Tax=Elioraea sp. Yellowstone TaxID=2592070 RepID=UPI0011540002|nr:MarC family protein [Elioraea sp. Yellowstone]TQF82223.1 MarC family protein [Elioraea sp. Yellowstone]
MLDLFLYAFVAFLVILDPPGTAAIFLGITPHDTPAERRAQALKATAIAGGVLVAFAVAGEFLLRALGIGLPAFQVAGGLLLFLLAADMVMVRQSGLRATEREQAEAQASDHDISVFPLAIPLIAGPGAMTTVVLLRGRVGDDPEALGAVVAALALALAVTLAAMLAASPLMRLLGRTGADVLSRVLGVVLAALAAQIVLDGVRAFFAG